MTDIGPWGVPESGHVAITKLKICMLETSGTRNKCNLRTVNVIVMV